MTLIGALQILILFALVVAVTVPLGSYMAKVFQGERLFLTPLMRPVERGVYALAGVSEEREMGWQVYLVAMLFFSVAGMLVTYFLLRNQNHLPLNPDHQSGVPGYLAWNTAVSFTTNTNWQNYAGETTMSHLSQMLALATHNFMSAATGMAIAIAFVRGLVRRSARELGNFWVDMTRSVLYVLLPISIIGALVYAAQGVPQTLSGIATVKTLEGAAQTIS
ncbi:MAG: potassium-transporting ATPase subunit KdpA, partial [Dehalococcoidia bacterium]